jgi:hypothetical protein
MTAARCKNEFVCRTIGFLKHSTITVQLWQGDFVVGKPGEIANSMMHPKTSMDTAHDVIELSGR